VTIVEEINALGSSMFLGNELSAWLIALVQFLVWFTVLPIARAFVGKRLKAVEAGQPHPVLELTRALLNRTTRLFLIVVATYLALQWLVVPERFDRYINGAMLVILWLQVAIWGTAAVRFVVERRLVAVERDAQGGSASLNIIKFVGVAAVWALALLMLLANLGVNITALVAGLGVGGIAIALAVQNVLGDLLASLSIALDKPFKVGDFLAVGSELGTVEHIGIKSTRLRSLSGEQIVMPNADLLGSRVRNFGRMFERRIVFSVGVTYETDRAMLREIPAIIERAIRRHEKTRFDRSHFAGFGDFSLNFESVYFVLDPAYGIYMDIQQAINLELVEQFAERGIDFAYPTSLQYEIRLPGPGQDED